MAIATAFDSEELSAPPLWFGAFRVTNRIAEGGTAYIFRGEHRETGEAVALKTVRTGLAHEITVLTREIATLQELKHPGIVRFVQHGTCDAGMPWMALELLEGRTLLDEIASLWAEHAVPPPRLRQPRAATGFHARRRKLAAGHGGRKPRTGAAGAVFSPARAPHSSRRWARLSGGAPGRRRSGSLPCVHIRPPDGSRNSRATKAGATRRRGDPIAP